MPSLGPRLSATSNILSHWTDLRSRSHWITALLERDENTSRPPRRNASTPAACRPFHDLSLPIKSDPNIISNSLRETVEAHRKANADYLKRLMKRTQSEPETASKKWKVKKPKAAFKSVKHIALRRGTYFPDYEGKICYPTKQWESLPSLSKNARHPWLRQLASPPSSADAQRHTYATDRLNAEVYAFESYMSPTTVETAAGEAALADLRTSLRAVDPHIQVDLIGSRSTGLATPTSDIDVNIRHPTFSDRILPTQRREEVLRMLENVGENLNRAGRENLSQSSSGNDRPANTFTVTEFVSEARVPILVGFHVPTNLQFQLQCTTDAFASMEFARAYLAEYPTLRPLFILLKYVLEIRGLARGALGGVGSYPLLIMVVASLKFGEPEVRGRLDVGKDLLFFLDMYSKIDFYMTGISLSPVEYFQKRRTGDSTKKVKKTKRSSKSAASDVALDVKASYNHTEEKPGRSLSLLNPSAPYLMSLQDPANPLNNLGAHAKLIKHVQGTFIWLKSELERAMMTWESETWLEKESGQKKDFSLLDCCLGADYTIFEQERNQVREWKKRQHTTKEIIAEFP